MNQKGVDCNKFFAIWSLNMLHVTCGFFCQKIVKLFSFAKKCHEYAFSIFIIELLQKVARDTRALQSTIIVLE